MKNIYFLFSVVFVFLFCASCKKNHPPKVSPPDTLPPITQIGANTFGCKINGQVWVPYYPCEVTWWSGTAELAYNIYPAYSTSMFQLRFSLEAAKSENPYSGIFSIEPAFLRSDTTGSYVYGIGNVADSMEIRFITNSGDWIPSYFAKNYIFQITRLDTINKIISGIFSFTLYKSFSDSLVITDGRFDLQIGQYSRCSN